MRSTLFSSILFFTFFIFSNQSLAYFHLEPSIGHTLVGSWEFDTGSTTGKNDTSVLDLGMRLGYQSPGGFQVGANFDIGVGGFESPIGDADIVSIDPYLMVGYQFDFGLRGFLGLSPSTYLTIDQNPIIGPETSFLGHGVKIGGGYLIQKIVAINLYYKYNDFRELDVEGSDGFESLGDTDFKTYSVNLSVSFPFNFGGKKKHKKRKTKEELEKSETKEKN